MFTRTFLRTTTQQSLKCVSSRIRPMPISENTRLTFKRDIWTMAERTSWTLALPTAIAVPILPLLSFLGSPESPDVYLSCLWLAQRSKTRWECSRFYSTVSGIRYGSLDANYMTADI
ncbi:hypothetical protein AVEN_54343-1 [Araneus ventricosus]|uniref:Uncharacterized protein n=1 Tax=Araneus ventricosus TaxID=182803 RepID=A0A4Y2GC06_ARAVE|nr:hypothetical protein AVEN_54343-1 [Araneus ventricosus]